MKRVFVVPGWKGKPTSNWFPWLANELRLWGVYVNVLAMPNAEAPLLHEWLETITKAVGEPDEETFFIGHSLGSIAILRYLESLPASTEIGGVISVAGFPESINRTEITTFFAHPLDYEKIKAIVAKKMIAIQSRDDPFVPFAHGETLRDKLGAKLVPVKNGAHFTRSSGHDRLVVVLEKLVLLGC